MTPAALALPSAPLVAPAAPPVLAARGVRKSFREGRETIEVLRGIDLELAAGEIVALEGPSGSGKTTLLQILGCILTPSSGEVVVDGEPVDPRRLPAIRRGKLGFVFQQYHLFPALDARANVEYAARIKGLGRRAARAEAERLLALVGLEDRSRFLPRDLSGGQKQRVAIARALVGSPPVLLADEPTANLDSVAGRQILALFHDLAAREQRALVVVTHDPAVRRFAHRTVGIRDGRLVAPRREARRP